MASTPQFATIPRSPQIQVVNADGNALKTVFLMGSNGGILKALWATSNDATARSITLFKTDGTTDLLVATMKLPAASAANPVRAVNFLDPTRLTMLDPYEIQWHLAPNHGFKVRMETAITLGAEVAVFAQYGEF
jgi:hypothetical protein